MERFLLYLTLVIIVSSCQCRNAKCDGQGTTDTRTITDSPVPVEPSGNGIYFWRTVFELNGYEREFIRAHSISRLYVKMFDVAPDKDWDTGEMGVFPVATTRFVSKCPDGVEIVPTVYITQDALRMSAGSEKELADRIVTRTLAMVSFNELGPVKAVQLDCDWTASTRESYRLLCRSVRDSLSSKGISLSGTVRLHQLCEGDFPFDKSVLMIYNTGSVKNICTENSIIDYDEVIKYVKEKHNLENVDFAYPTFGWGVWFRNGEFKALLHTTDFSDESIFRQKEDGVFSVIRNCDMEGHHLLRGDVIRLESSDIKEIMKIKSAVESALGRNHHNIIYHLDSVNLVKYTKDEIDSIYSL